MAIGVSSPNTLMMTTTLQEEVPLQRVVSKKSETKPKEKHCTEFVVVDVERIYSFKMKLWPSTIAQTRDGRRHVTTHGHKKKPSFLVLKRAPMIFQHDHSAQQRHTNTRHRHAKKTLSNFFSSSCVTVVLFLAEEEQNLSSFFSSSALLGTV